MSTARLTFLYPHLFRSARLGESAAARTVRSRCRKPAANAAPRAAAAAALSTTTRANEAVFERHGKAVNPQLPDVVQLPQPQSPAAASSEASSQKDAAAGEQLGAEMLSDEAKEEAARRADTAPKGGTGATREAEPTPQQKAAEEKMQSSGPMDAVLHMPPPGAVAHPHIAKPPYVHHFDTYTLVKQLEAGGYSKDQAITVMKAVRALLAQNLDVAQEGLVSKSDVDNETYLFRAACSELSSEVTNNRKSADEVSRQQRTLLHHEVDILNQKLSQDLMTLRDDVKGMFNDRKMAVREEERRQEGAIQQVNLDISVTLTSDAKSEIEGLRWILIRRSVLGIIFMAVLTLGTLRYATYVNHENKKAADEKAREAENLKRNGGREDKAPAHEAAAILAAN
ncbi:hypothetical protein JX265_009253 [Neoarthrinium moseri]|uniref:MOZ protein represents a chromatin-associated acetyltransferase n=1 Tax=Neoarthrinium moseri TaxID=1658444 RepID=A0A9P9WGU1_9PEZI|nr:hypothetical protein JX265_009253 [Neoarthrinium moseri]